jgi:hypothetical protein
MTKLKLIFMLSVLLGGSLLNTQTSASQTKVSPALLCSLGTDRDKARHQKGAEVGTRVRELRMHSKNVDRALAAFERNEKRNGNKPRIDESESFTIDAAGRTTTLKTADQESVSERQL